MSNPNVPKPVPNVRVPLRPVGILPVAKPGSIQSVKTLQPIKPIKPIVRAVPLPVAPPKVIPQTQTSISSIPPPIAPTQLQTQSQTSIQPPTAIHPTTRPSLTHPCQLYSFYFILFFFLAGVIFSQCRKCANFAISQVFCFQKQRTKKKKKMHRR